jgi:opine dehydrogenase
MNEKNRFTIIGAGGGGRAMAAHLAIMGYSVALYNRSPEHLEGIKKRGGIELEWRGGGPSGFGKLDLITSNIAEAVAFADTIMVVVPSTAHRHLAHSMAPYLRDGQIIVLNPGRTFGALEFTRVLLENNCLCDITIAEAETFLFASRAIGASSAHIFCIKDNVPLAALPAIRTPYVLEAINPAYPQFIDGINVLYTSFNNMGAIFHPMLTLLNAGRIESPGEQFQFYVEGVTPSVARMMEALDEERMAVASAIGIYPQSAVEWLAQTYHVYGENLYEALKHQSGYAGIYAPDTLDHRYIFEDVPMSLVPMASLAHQMGVPVPGMDSVINLACILHDRDYWQSGRSLERLGMVGINPDYLLSYVSDGMPFELRFVQADGHTADSESAIDH